jgi:ferrous iron transport protein B
MTPDTKAEEVALKMVDKETLIVNVVDATNLERNLNLTLQLKEAGLPIIIALNMWDDTKHRGITIDTEALEKGLGVPVVPTCGLTGEGVKRLIERFEEASPGRAHVIPESERWKNIGNIVSNAQKLTHKHHTFLETLEDMSIRPLSGAIFAVIMLFLSFTAVRTIAETLINYVFNPIFDLIWLPVMKWLSAVLGADSFLHSLLIGNLINGKIDFEMSFGMLTTGLYIQLAAILPYIFSFYLILSLLEDLGYLPRLAVLVDNIMHKIGLHGYAIIPVILSLGCKCPG